MISLSKVFGSVMSYETCMHFVCSAYKQSSKITALKECIIPQNQLFCILGNRSVLLIKLDILFIILSLV